MPWKLCNIAVWIAVTGCGNYKKAKNGDGLDKPYRTWYPVCVAVSCRQYGIFGKEGSDSLVRENKITEGVIWKQLLAFFFPILLGTFFQQLYNTVDAIIVGNFVGTQALAAVGGATGTIINLLVGFFVGLSAGATVIISQYYGARRARETSQAVHTSVAMGIAGGLLFMVLGMLISPWALRAMGTPEDVMEPAITYIEIYFGGMVFNLLYNMGSGILRAVGDSKRPLYFLILCTVLNLVLDLLFVPVFHWGVAGVAIATIVSQAVSAILILVILMFSDDVYRLHWKEVRLDFYILRNIIQIGLPAGLQSVMYNVSNIIIQSTINTFGTNTVAAWTAYGKIDGLFWMIMGAFGTSVTTFSGQNFGAQKYDRIRKSVRICTVMAMGTAFLLSTVLYFWGSYVYQLFSSDSKVIEIGMEILHTMVPFYFTYVCIEILSGTMRGTGDSLIPMIITGVGICVLRVVWIFVAVPMWPGIQSVIISYPITWAFTSILFIIYYLQGGWLRKRITRMGFAPEVRQKHRKG